jgi:hypothetical protein
VRIPSPPARVQRISDVLPVMKDLDLIGFTLFAATMVQFLLPLQWGGNQYPWDSVVVICLFCTAFATMIIFIVWEYFTGENAMIPLSILRIRVVWSSCLYYGMQAGSSLCGIYYIPIYFQAVKGVSPITSGVWILPTILSQLFSALLFGILSMHILLPPFLHYRLIGV